jgi:hypothetical protein
MGSLLRAVSSLLLGDDLDIGLQPRPSTYEDVHGEVQAILIPPTLPKGVSVYVLQSLNKSFALQHK